MQRTERQGEQRWCVVEPFAVVPQEGDHDEIGATTMRRWFRWFFLRAFRKLSFSKIHHFLIDIAALTLLAISIYRLVEQDIRHVASPPEPVRQEQPQNYQKPESPPPKVHFVLVEFP